MRTLGRGSATGGSTSWGLDDPPEVRTVRVREVRSAMLDAYPFLADLGALVPAGVLDTVPEGSRGWATGQWFTKREADVIGAAMGYCVARSVPVLPVHDALIVPRWAAGVARKGLRGAYRVLARVAVGLKG